MAKKGFNTFTQMGKDWEQGINFERLRRERLQRTREAMAHDGLGAIVVLRAENIRYISGIRSQIQRPGRYSYYTVLPIEGDPVHFEIGGDLGRLKENAPWMEGRLFAAFPLGDNGPMIGEAAEAKTLDQWYEQIYKVLKENGVANQKIGFDAVNFETINKLQKSGLKFVDGRKTMFDARVIKTRDELELCFITATVADACFQKIKDVAQVGVKESEVWGEVVKTAFVLGAENISGILTSGGRTNPYYRLMGSDKILGPGDLLISDVLVNIMGYWSCVVRTFLIGSKPATSEQKAAHRAAYEALYNGINACKAGVTTDKVAAKFIQEGFETFSLNIGHGLGLSVQEEPVVHPTYSKEFPFKLKANMQLAFETFVATADGRQGVRLEEDFIVTEDGVEVITRYPFDERLM